MTKFIYNLIVIIFSTLLIMSCASVKKENMAKDEYSKAMEYIKNSNFIECANKFNEVIEEFPFSIWAKEAKILAAYCHFKEQSYGDVIALTDDYISNYPADQDVVYMQYLRSLSYYKQMPYMDRSQDESKIALYGFKDIISKDSRSIHAKDAIKKIKIINENIAGYYMEIGRFYQQKDNLIGAINNFNYVINNYSFTNQYPESLYRIYAIYYKLGITEEADKAKNNLLNLSLEEDNKWLTLIKKSS